MIKVTIVSNNPRVDLLASENKTVRQLLNENNIILSNAAVSIDGFTLGSPAELDKPLVEHSGGRSSMTIGIFVNKDNAAEAVVVGSACVIKSTLTPDQIKQIKKLHPEWLTMVDDNGEPVFAMDIDETLPGSLNEYGAVFGNSTSSDGKATITVVIDPEAEDPAQVVEETLGGALLSLDEMETALAEELPNLQAEVEKVKSMITRM